jgi:hypothetical protein
MGIGYGAPRVTTKKSNDLDLAGKGTFNPAIAAGVAHYARGFRPLPADWRLGGIA